MGEMILVLGGARSGKSTFAEQLARRIGGNQVLYVATAEGQDDEMRERILIHQQQRPIQWQTIEAPVLVAEQLYGIELPAVVLLDCVTLLASNILVYLPEDCNQAQANDAILREIDNISKLQQNSLSTWIIVSNEVGMGVVPPFRLGRLYQDALGRANQRLAQAADKVVLMVAGLAWYLKGT